MKHFLPVVFLFVCSAAMAQAPYVINQNTNKGSGGDNSGMGSSFLTLAAGQLDSIEVYIRTGTYSTGTLKVFAGNTNDEGSLLYEQTLTGIPTGILNAPYMAKLTYPVVLSAASTYTFMIYNTPLRFGNSNTYADGTMWVGQGFLTAGEYTDRDMDFIAYIGEVIASSTLSSKEEQEQWFTLAGRMLTMNSFSADEIGVYNLQGQHLLGAQGQSLNLENISEGIYVVRARKENKWYAARVFVK